MVLVSGEPGIGKTRLSSELARRAHTQGMTVLYGRCDDELGVPYQPFVEALAFVVDNFEPAVFTEALGRHAGELTRLVPRLAEHLDNVPDPMSPDPETSQYRLFEAVASALTVGAAARPILFVIDDLHWAAKPTLLMLRHIATSTDPARLLIVCTYRDTDLYRAQPLGRGARRPAATRPRRAGHAQRPRRARGGRVPHAGRRSRARRLGPCAGPDDLRRDRRQPVVHRRGAPSPPRDRRHLRGGRSLGDGRRRHRHRHPRRGARGDRSPAQSLVAGGERRVAAGRGGRAQLRPRRCSIDWSTSTATRCSPRSTKPSTPASSPKRVSRPTCSRTRWCAPRSTTSFDPRAAPGCTSGSPKRSPRSTPTRSNRTSASWRTTTHAASARETSTRRSTSRVAPAIGRWPSSRSTTRCRGSNRRGN